MAATRDRLLFLLKSLGTATTATLAGRLGISPQAAREQLALLEADGLIAWEDVATGRGRPKRHWRLTEAAQSRFPDTHAALAVELIGAIRSELGNAALDRLIARREADTAAQYKAALAACRRLDLKVMKLAELRSAEGYMAEVAKTEDGRGFLLIENHCPICAAARACQNFCRAELEVFRQALGDGAEVTRTEHLLAGARRCAYRITPRRGGERSSSARA
jgi:predicted ArsR family transcriptional regulator